jgi:hypothetical protein
MSEHGATNLLIKHVTQNALSCGNQTKCTSGWYAQMVHCLTAEKLPNTATENCKPISCPAVRSLACPFQLKLPPLSLIV